MTTTAYSAKTGVAKSEVVSGLPNKELTEV